MKKNKLKDFRVLDSGALTASQRNDLLQTWTALRDEPLSPISLLQEDATRIRIDVAVASTLGISNEVLAALRGLLGSEPRFQPPAPEPVVVVAPGFEQKPLF